MLQIAKSEKMVDRLQLAAFAGCKTKSVEEFSEILATFRLIPILLFLYFCEVNFITLSILDLHVGHVGGEAQKNIYQFYCAWAPASVGEEHCLVCPKRLVASQELKSKQKLEIKRALPVR